MTLDLDRHKKKTKIKRRKTLTSEVRSGYSMLIAVVIILNLVIGASYFAVNSQKTVLGYKLNELQLTNKSLRNEAKRIESSIVDATAFKQIEHNAQLSKMIEVEVIDYTIGSARTAVQY